MLVRLSAVEDFEVAGEDWELLVPIPELLPESPICPGHSSHERERERKKEKEREREREKERERERERERAFSIINFPK